MTLSKAFGKAWEIWLFPARLVHYVSYYFFFLERKGSHAGRSGFSGLVLACSINILLHLGFALFGVSYWELCDWIGEGFGSRPGIGRAGIVYLIINGLIGVPMVLNYLDRDNIIAKLSYIHESWQRKVASVVGFFIFVPGIPFLNYWVAMWTLEPWY